MSFRGYAAYKDAGPLWLGEVPRHWVLTPLWKLFRRIKRTGHASEQLLSVYRDYGVISKASRDDNNNKPSEDLDGYQLVCPDDLAINKMKAWQGSVGISMERGIVSPAYFVYAADHQEHSRYLHYLLRSPQYTAGYLSLSKGIRVHQWDLDPQYHSRMPVLLPPVGEQRAIATFLDRETAKIDALVDEQKRLIELLKEKRQAVISHAVTKGLDPNAPMKDSGVEWLGQVPAHWEVGALKRFWTVTDCKHITAPFVDEGFPLASIREVQSKYVALDEAKQTTEDYYLQLIEGGRAPEPRDLIFSRNATVGQVAQVADWHRPFAMGQDVCLLRRASPAASPDFLQYVIDSKVVVEQLAVAMVGATFKRINVEEIRNLIIPWPDPAEQEQICQFLEEMLGISDRMIKESRAAIALLLERRSALISAAVTGKIDVRGVAIEVTEVAA